MRKRGIVIWTLLFIIALVGCYGGMIFLMVPKFANMIYLGAGDVTAALPYIEECGHLLTHSAFIGGTEFTVSLCENVADLFVALVNGTLFTNIANSELNIGFLVISGVFVIAIIIHVICFIKSRKVTMWLWLIFDAVAWFALLVALDIARFYIGPGLNSGDLWHGTLLGQILDFGAFGDNWLMMLFLIALLICGLVVVISTIVLIFMVPVYAVRTRKPRVFKAKDEPEEDLENPFVEDEQEYALGGTTNNINTIGNASPLIVQYINSYGQESVMVRPGQRSVQEEPVAEVKKEEKEEEVNKVGTAAPQPGYPYPPYPYGPYGYPYPWAPYPWPVPATSEKEEKEEKITKEDVKAMLNEALDEREDPSRYDVVYETEDGDEVEYVDFDDIRALIHEEVKQSMEELSPVQTTPATEPEPEPVEPVKAVVEEAPVVEEKPVEPVKEVKVQPVAPIVVAVPAKAVEEDVKEEEKVEAEPALSEDEVRAMISEELKEVLKELPRPVERKVVHKVVEKEVVVEEKPTPAPAPAPAPVAEPEVKKEVAAPAPAPTPVAVVEAPKAPARPVRVPPKPLEVRGKEASVEKGEVIRQNFLERVTTGDELMQSNYNALKTLLLSYGLKSRVSATGDTFRAHKVTYAKITAVGDSLRIYLALNPQDYYSTALPVQDVSNKDAYKDIPLSFKVRSDLSLRRANELIQSCMLKAEMSAKEGFEGEDYVAELKKSLDEAK